MKVVVEMAHRTMGRRGGRGRGLMVKNGDGLDNFGNQNHKVEELSQQVATLNDKVQILLLNRQIAILI